jgi:D-alanyl-D-alanine carboxypeptidase
MLGDLLQTGVPGVVAVGPGGAHAAGFADVAAQRAMQVGDTFRLASVGKPFVAALVLMLVADGLLDLDDAADDDGPATVRQLLNHTSGLPDHIGPDLFADPHRAWSPSDLIALAARKPPTPVGEFSYSNTGYVVLGRLVERITGETFGAQLARRITEPLGLAATGIGRAPTVRGYAPGDNPFAPSDEPLADVSDVGKTWGGPAGGLLGSAPDVARFLRALLGGVLVPPALLTEMKTTVPADGVEWTGYGLGISTPGTILGEPPCEAWGHLGFGLGTTIAALATPDGSRAVVVAANVGLVGEPTLAALGRLVFSMLCP